MLASTWPLLYLLANLLPISAAFGEVDQQPLSSPESTIITALKDADVIPDVLDDFYPSVSIILSYPHSHHVDLGNTLKPKAVRSPPNLYIDVLSLNPTRTWNPNATYVLALTDPDATSRSDPVKAQMCHWIVGNIPIPVESLKTGGIHVPLPSQLDITPEEGGMYSIKSYFPPSPPPRTGFHRYIFVLLQTSADGSHSLTKPKERPHWGYGKIGTGVREWAAENDLEVVGANFFYAANSKRPSS